MSDDTVAPAVTTGRGPRVSRLGVVAVVASFGGLLFGYDTGVINGALDPLGRDLGLTPVTEGVVVSLLVVGAAFGALLGGRVSDRHGRRRALLVLAVVFIGGTLGCVLSPTWEVLAAFRFVLGLAVGGASATVPVYLAEVAPAERRGGLVTRNEVMIVSGQFAAFVVNAAIFTVWGDVDGIWRAMLLVAVLPAIALLVGMLGMPESPRWLAAQGRDEEALAVLRTIRPTGGAAAELEEVRRFAADEAARSGAPVDLSARWVRRLIAVGAGLGVFQQFTGINSVMYYGTQLLGDVGFSADASIVANTLNGLFSVLGITVGILLINRIDRRVMLLAGFTLTTTFHLLIGLSAALLPSGPGQAWAVLVFVVAFVFCMQGTLGPLTWLILSEIFPLSIRSVAIGISVFVLWIANAVVALVFPPLIETIGIAPTFFVFVALGLAALVFAHRYVPETRGRSLEELETRFRAAGT